MKGGIFVIAAVTGRGQTEGHAHGADGLFDQVQSLT